MSDQTLVCGCGNEFIFSQKDQDFYAVNSFTPPKRCRPCRDVKKKHYEDKEKKAIAKRIMSGEKVNLN